MNIFPFQNFMNFSRFLVISKFEILYSIPKHSIVLFSIFFYWKFKYVKCLKYYFWYFEYYSITKYKKYIFEVLFLCICIQKYKRGNIFQSKKNYLFMQHVIIFNYVVILLSRFWWVLIDLFFLSTFLVLNFL